MKDARPRFQYRLASVWDLETANHRLYFTNTGTHQLARLDLNDGTVAPIAGTGGEALVDGPGSQALLAQPSGLALDDLRNHLYFADSENSAVRKLDLHTHQIHRLVGTGLFEFGQRPLVHSPFATPAGAGSYRFDTMGSGYLQSSNPTSRFKWQND